MELVLGAMQSPVFLGVLILFGLFSLVWVLVARGTGLRWFHHGDRRRSDKMPEMPFHDSDGVLVSENRRIQIDRRHNRLLVIQHRMKKRLLVDE